MSDNFDPYFKWLGIPPEQQPPDHYRLLGVPAFVADVDVISHAADQRMTHLRGFQNGQHAALSQQLLNHVAAARACLLSPERKAQYDAQLREYLPARVTPSSDLRRGGLLTATPLDARTVVVPPPENAEVPRLAAPPPTPSPAPPPAEPEWDFTTAVAPARRRIRGTSAGKSDRDFRRFRTRMIYYAVIIFGLAICGGILLSLQRNTSPQRNPPSLAAPRTTPPAPVVTPPIPPRAVSKSRPLVAIDNRATKPSDQAVLMGPRHVAPPMPAEMPHTNQRPPTQANFGDQGGMQAADEALARRDMNSAIQILTPIANNPRSSQQQQANLLLGQIAMTTSNDWGRNQLMDLDNESFDQFIKGKAQFEFRNDQQPLHPVLVSVANETLRRVLPEVQQRRRLAPAGQPRDALGIHSPVPVGAPVDPADVLRARGMKRVFDTWVVADEARCEELAEQARKAVFRQPELARQVRSMTSELTKARTKLNGDAAAVKRAETAGKPADGTPERTALVEKVTESQNAVDAAQAELERLRKETADAAKEQADSLEQARTLAAGVDDQYRRLAADPQIKDVLGQLQQKLGPSEEFKKLQAEINRGRPRGK